MLEGAGDLVSRLFIICRVISALNGVTPIITLLITNLLSPLPLQVLQLGPSRLLAMLLLLNAASIKDCICADLLSVPFLVILERSPIVCFKGT